MTESSQQGPQPGKYLDPFERRVARAWPLDRWAGVTTLVAVSGGADSLALAQALRAIRSYDATGKLVLVHFNHRLRGKESDADEAFVVTWSRQAGLPLIVGRNGEPVPTAHGLTTTGLKAGEPLTPFSYSQASSSENAWRHERYSFFEFAARMVGARYLATAHTADDQVETVVQRIVRGTGISGLTGIPFARRINEALTVVRPLLGTSRRAVEAYLARQGLTFRTDSSNASIEFQRNRVRHETLPALARLVGRDPKPAILRLVKAAREVQEGLHQRVLQDFDRCVQMDLARATAVIDCSTLLEKPKAERRETLLLLWRHMGWPLEGMGRRQWSQLVAAAHGKAAEPRPAKPGAGEQRKGKQRGNPRAAATNMLPGGIRLEQRGDALQLWREDAK